MKFFYMVFVCAVQSLLVALVVFGSSIDISSAVDANNVDIEGAHVKTQESNKNRESKPKHTMGVNYTMASGDEVEIHVTGEPDLSINVRLGDDGKINYPFLGSIPVVGMTVSQLDDFITDGLENGYLVNPQVQISIIEYRPFFINGGVKNSGGYPFQPGLTFQKAISLAGGFSKGSSEGRVLVIHENMPRKKAIEMSLNSRVSPGDIILVRQSEFYVNGEVKRPGGYPFQLDLTIRMAISLAGGFTERASKDEVKVIHQNDPSRKAKGMPLTGKVLPGDIVTVKKSFF